MSDQKCELISELREIDNSISKYSHPRRLKTIKKEPEATPPPPPKVFIELDDSISGKSEEITFSISPNAFQATIKQEIEASTPKAKRPRRERKPSAKVKEETEQTLPTPDAPNESTEKGEEEEEYSEQEDPAEVLLQEMETYLEGQVQSISLEDELFTPFGKPTCGFKKSEINYKIKTSYQLTEEDEKDIEIENKLYYSYKNKTLGKTKPPENLQPRVSKFESSIMKEMSKIKRFTPKWRKERLSFIKWIATKAAQAGRKRLERISPSTHELERRKRMQKISRIFKEYYTDLEKLAKFHQAEIENVTKTEITEPSKVNNLVEKSSGFSQALLPNVSQEENDEVLELFKNQNERLDEVLLKSGYQVDSRCSTPESKAEEDLLSSRLNVVEHIFAPESTLLFELQKMVQIYFHEFKDK